MRARLWLCTVCTHATYETVPFDFKVKSFVDIMSFHGWYTDTIATWGRAVERT